MIHLYINFEECLVPSIVSMVVVLIINELNIKEKVNTS
jgi:hypothetical protein